MFVHRLDGRYDSSVEWTDTGRAAHLVTSLRSAAAGALLSCRCSGTVDSWRAVSTHMRKCATKVSAARFVVDDTSTSSRSV